MTNIKLERVVLSFFIIKMLGLSKIENGITKNLPKVEFKSLIKKSLEHVFETKFMIYHSF